MTDPSSTSHVEPRHVRSDRARRCDVWLAAALLLALVSIVHHDILFQGRSLVLSNAWNPMDYRPLPQNYGDGFIPVEEWTGRNLWLYPNIRDPMATLWQWEPALAFLRDAIQQREWPFWNPHVAAGTPAMANMVPAFFFPPSLLVTTLGGSVHLLNAYFLFLLWSASFLTFLFLRRHDLGFVASFTGGVIVLMGGSLNQNLGSFLMQPAACIPLALYATRVFLDAPTLRSTAVLALVYASIALASFPPLLVGVYGVTAAYAVTGMAFGDCGIGRSRAVACWLAAVALSGGLVGFYYGPAFVLLSDTAQVTEIYRAAGLLSMPGVDAFQLLSPTLMGGPQVYLSAPFAEGNAGTPSLPYVGAACVFMSLLARPKEGRPNRTLFVASGLTVAGILLKVFGVRPVQWIGYLPIFDHVHFSVYLGVPLGFPLAFLGAMGLDALTRGAVSIGRSLAATALALAAIGGLWWIAADAGALRSPTAQYWIRDWMFVAFITVAGATTLVVTVASGLQPRVRHGVAGVVLALVVAEGIYNNSYPNPRAWDAFAHPSAYIRAMQQPETRDRILSFGAPVADVNEAFGIDSLDSLMPFNPPRVYDLYSRYADNPRQAFMRGATRIPPEPVLDRCNIAFISIRNAFADLLLAARQRGYTSRFDDGFVTVFARSTLPRFFHSTAYRVMPKARALEAIASIPSREIVLEEGPGFPSTQSEAGDSIVRVDAYRRNSVVLTVDAQQPGLLYAAESFMAGWSARVNGETRRILPANYAFRAVEVPAGRSRVEFSYWPPGLTAGLWASTVSVGVFLGLLGASIRKQEGR